MQIKGYLVIFVVYIYDYFLLYAKISAVMLSLYASFPITLLLLFFLSVFVLNPLHLPKELYLPV